MPSNGKWGNSAKISRQKQRVKGATDVKRKKGVKARRLVKKRAAGLKKSASK